VQARSWCWETSSGLSLKFSTVVTSIFSWYSFLNAASAFFTSKILSLSALNISLVSSSNSSNSFFASLTSPDSFYFSFSIAFLSFSSLSFFSCYAISSSLNKKPAAYSSFFLSARRTDKVSSNYDYTKGGKSSLKTCVAIMGLPSGPFLWSWTAIRCSYCSCTIFK